MTINQPLRVGIGGPVGSGKTALMDLLCKSMRPRYDIAAITNDIYTKWDAEFLVRSGSLSPDRIAGVETGGCPHTAIREDASMNLAAVADMDRYSASRCEFVPTARKLSIDVVEARVIDSAAVGPQCKAAKASAVVRELSSC